jgi:3-dehydroquinate synthase
VGIGGGATTDLAGFVAATYLRGVDWVAIPTTVAGMVDAAIGGKTGVNLTSGKNLAGAFYSPKEVVIDTSWLSTLSDRDIRAGLAEAVKCGFISEPKILDLIFDWKRNLTEIIALSVGVKADVVSRDFKESYEREILNYGHTLGHAIEKYSDYSLRHGEAVSIGMCFAADLSVMLSGLSGSIAEKHREILQSLELPVTYSATAFDGLFDLMQSDKKRGADGLRFVTLKALGSTDRVTASKEVLNECYLESVGR